MDDEAKIAALRARLVEEGVDGFLLPLTDEYQGEYCAPYARRVTWLSGFDGSAGMVVVLQKRAALLVDGRYTIQAAREVDASLYDVHNTADMSVSDYLRTHAKGCVIAYDPRLHTVAQIRRWEALGVCRLVALAHNPVDAIWHDQPARPLTPITEHALRYAGCRREEKIAQTIAQMQADALLLTEPDAICWLLNIRGSDIPYNPLPLCYCVLRRDGRVHLMIDPAKVPADLLGTCVEVVDEAQIEAWLSSAGLSHVQIDPVTCPAWFAQRLRAHQVTLHEADSPVAMLKAVKNEVEIAGMRAAHIADGRAVRAFSRWLEALPQEAHVTELDIIAQLQACRQKCEDYIQPSFATIAGAGEHGAIVHYRADEGTNRAWLPGEVLLVDSGGQYPYGTTDITRTYVRGEASAQCKRHYTLVLKGHIALACAVFPEGTTGHQLDVLARQFLWQEGLDYQHGTGHGVGCFLCVHEGPQSISARANAVALRPGMVLSNEPGFYLAGEYGIRIESLVLVVEKYQRDGRRYFAFDTLSAASIDASLVDATLLTSAERAWLEQYNTQAEQI